MNGDGNVVAHVDADDEVVVSITWNGNVNVYADVRAC